MRRISFACKSMSVACPPSPDIRGWSVPPPSVRALYRDILVLRSFSLGKCRWHWAGVFHFASVAAFAAATVLILAFCASQSSVLSLRSLAFILSSVPCFVKRARSASADSPLCPAMCSSSRSEEHTSELQSHSDLVCRLLLEKKKKKKLHIN